jgi:PAS domain S-box-containing protein
VNAALVRIYGYHSAEEMVAVLNDIEHQLYVSPRRRAEFAKILEQQDVVIDFESEIYRRDKTKIWIKENARAVHDKQGQLLYYEGTVEDITARRHAEEELRRINRASDRFVPYQLLDLLGKKSITELQLNDCVQRRMSIVFMDIRSFTALSEQMSPLENFQFLNSFLSQMGPIIQRHGGFIDKYLGDGILALFEQAPKAVEASIAMLQQLELYNEAKQEVGEQPLNIGIGINTGEVMVGTVGYNKRLEGTVIGDTVNLAARIEQLTKHYEVPLLIGQDTFNELELPMQNFIRFVDLVRVKGKTRQVMIYEVFTADPPHMCQAKWETKTVFESGWLLYQQGQLAEAKELFSTCLKQNLQDVIAQKYLEQCLADAQTEARL